MLTCRGWVCSKPCWTAAAKICTCWHVVIGCVQQQQQKCTHVGMLWLGLRLTWHMMTCCDWVCSKINTCWHVEIGFAAKSTHVDMLWLGFCSKPCWTTSGGGSWRQGCCSRTWCSPRKRKTRSWLRYGPSQHLTFISTCTQLCAFKFNLKKQQQRFHKMSSLWMIKMWWWIYEFKPIMLVDDACLGRCKTVWLSVVCSVTVRVCVCIHVHAYMCVCDCAFVYTCVYMTVCICVCVCVYMCMCDCIYVYVCVSCMCIILYIYMYLCIYIVDVIVYTCVGIFPLL